MSFKKFLLIVNTIKYLTFKQAVYQVWYRLKAPLLHYISYKKYRGKNLYPLCCSTQYLILSSDKYFNYNRFNFLNLEHSFKNDIDWSYMGYGKLWNYNLQYFDYLHDDEMSSIVKQTLIDDFSNQLLNHSIKPEPYPVSLRLTNWILYFSHTDCTSAVFQKAIQYQVDYLESNLEYHILANHLLENYYALFICGFALKDKRLVRKFFSRIEDELQVQVLNDGGHYECSPMYHCILLSKLLIIIDIIHNNKFIQLDDTFLKHKVAEMLGWLKAYCYQDGSYAHMNDSTEGIAVHANKLFAAAKFLGIKPTKKELRESGYRKFSDNMREVIVDVGNIIPSYQPGHAHSDIFSFAFNYKGNFVIVDTGTSTYENNSKRNFERSAIAHNSVVVHDKNQSQVWGSFRVAKRAKSKIDRENSYSIRASHNGYFKEFGITHIRRFCLKNETFEIVDEIMGKKSEISIAAYFHLDSSISITAIVNYDVKLSNGLQIYFKDAQAIKVDDFQQAYGFNNLKNSKKIVVSFSNQLTTQISFL